MKSAATAPKRKNLVTNRPAVDPKKVNDMIRQWAQQIYEQRGRIDGFELDDWLQAETELRGQ